MSLEAAHTLALLHRQYPFGIPPNDVHTKPFVFFSRKKLSVEGQELVLNVAVKGLKLHPDEFVLEVERATIPAQTLIIFGDLKTSSTEKFHALQTISTYEVEELLSEPSKKKEFWERIKPFVRT